MTGPRLKDVVYEAGIIVESPRLCESIVAADDRTIQVVSEWRLDSDYYEVVSFSGARIPILIAQGAPMIADAVERLVATGASMAVRIGTAGGLRRGQTIGDLVVALAAVNRDGTSRSYLPDCFPAIADHNLVRRLCERIGERIGKTLDASIVWTTDGRWIESDGDIEELSRLGVAAVDMESAALFAAARRRDIGSASISVITDLPVLHLGQEFKGVPQSEREWREVVVPRARMVLEVVLEALGTRDLGHA